MSFLEPKTIPMFYFTGDKATTPSCPVDLQPDLNPSSGAQSYSESDADCTLSASYNIPFFLDNLGPKFQEWSVNAHEARPGHHTQVICMLYNNQINARTLIGQLAMVYCAINPWKKRAASELLYKSNRPQVSTVYTLINHLGCW